MSWSESRRVVITGLGLITPLGLDVSKTWNGILSGKSGISVIKNFEASGLDCKIAGEILLGTDKGCFNPENYVSPRDVKRMAKFIHYGIAAAQEAVADSGLNLSECESSGVVVGICMGSGIGGLGNIENAAQELASKKHVSPFFIPSTLVNLLAGQVSIRYGITGPNIALATACTTGTHSIGEAARTIMYGDASIMIAGSAESSITPLGVKGFCSCQALSTKFNDEPTKASRPWDKDRDGFVMSEGAGVVILEEYSRAKARGANIYAEIVGYGLSGDGYHITAPHPEGKGAKLCIERAINKAKINYEDIDYINAHGTSTGLGDKIELEVVQKMFFEKNENVVMSSTKSSIGHMLGAAGSVEVILCALSLRNQIVPPTINLDNPLEDAKINLVPHFAINKKLTYVLSNSFGFGGTNASIILKKV